MLLEEDFSNHAWLSVSRAEGMLCAANELCSAWSGVFVGALTAATLPLQLVLSLQSSGFVACPRSNLRAGLCVDVALCGLGHSFGPALPKPLLSFSALRPSWAQL